MKTKTLFICQECGAQFPRWTGKCSSCESWNSLVEESVNPVSSQSRRETAIGEPVFLNDIVSDEEKRIQTGILELDRVLGGGIVPGAVTLIGGNPGIGKSTLSLQMSCSFGKENLKVLYVSGEESVKQTKLRADRLGLSKNASILMVNQLNLVSIIEFINKIKPQVVVIDSIQVIFHPDVSSSPGSVSQVRECSSILTNLAKMKNIAMFIIGHVTKEGMIAGPRVLEHIVDTVLYFEGERYSSYRILRTTKNRFGSTNEIGVFEMSSNGLVEVSNPSEIFLSERAKQASGSVVVPILEGTRPFLVEVQGLVSRSSFGVVRHKAQGFDANRLALLVAVLQNRLSLNLQDKDVFLNIVGGVKVLDPAADLAVAIAVASALQEKIVDPDVAVLGEIGLSAEVRSVSQIVPRINEAQRLGFKKCIVPKNNLKAKSDINVKGISLIAVEDVKEALDFIKK